MTDAEITPVENDAPPSRPKVDPETFVLRGKPSPAIRFKRGVIVSLAAIAACGVAGTAWFALEPGALRAVVQNEDAEPAAKAPAEALGTLPATYDAAPKLGPPLPGDLGRPILERQRQLAGATDEAPPLPAGAPSVAEAHERRIAELKAARESGLLVQPSRTAMATAPSGSAPVAVDRTSESTAKLSIDPEHDPNAQQRKADFVQAAPKASDTNSHVVAPPPSPFTLSAGSVIPASLVTGLRSDLPGLVVAQVTETIFDSATGHVLLIPQGARLIGTYDSVVAFGQKRALIVWQRILFPDGSSIRLENAPATDPSGYAGVADKVDFHTWTLLKGVVISTLLGVGAQLQFSGESNLMQALRESTQQSVSRAGDQLTSRNLQVQPTITVRPGAPVRLLVHQDLILKPWKETR
jgi:type IV secretion system protein VirB10